MKKLGKKVHNSMETIEAYACTCADCSFCSCSYAGCGNNTAVMVSNFTNNQNAADATLFNYGYYTGT